MSQWDDELQNTWERSGLAIPAITFAEHRKGDGFVDAVLLPWPVGKFAGHGFREEVVLEPQEIKGPDGKPMKNPKAGQPRRWESDGKVMQRTVLTLSIPSLKGKLSFDGFVSEKALERIELARKGGDDNDLGFLNLVDEWGLRTLYIQGGSLEPGFKATVKAVTKMPQIGGLLDVHLAALVANDYGGKTKEYSVKYGVPTPASLQIVADWQARAATAVWDFLGINARKPSRPAEGPSDEAKEADARTRAAMEDDDPPF